MGTRNLTCVVLGGIFRIAQYCQWDGYPEGQGTTVLDFLKNKMDRERFETALKQTKWITQEELRQLYDDVGADGSGLISMEIADEFKSRQPQLDRDMGAMVLEFVQEADCPVLLNDEHEFAKDGLFCEWAYVIDLDNDKLEVYSGFRKEAQPEGNRFGSEIGEDGYATVGLVKAYDLNDLPDEETFIKELTPRDEDEDEDEELMTKDAVFAVIDHIRSGDHGNDIVADRICNYMEANVDEFLEAYEMIDRE
jgi:hypothetical protein